jgi:hypothetical protein
MYYALLGQIASHHLKLTIAPNLFNNVSMLCLLFVLRMCLVTLFYNILGDFALSILGCGRSPFWIFRHSGAAKLDKLGGSVAYQSEITTQLVPVGEMRVRSDDRHACL